MCLWIFVICVIYSAYSQEAQYECGAHGRFEYCIDGIPGCVIGCHCHPGYYFDTDSKICEPNIKLTRDIRRQYLPEPTRVQAPAVTYPVIEEITTAKSPIDDKLDEITQDADELGDWLYNQFFKTIENQVINNTKDENIVNTRRSGSSVSFVKKPHRRSHKYWRGRKKKKKKKSAKTKFLRIAEDDSIFDSSSGSTSDESSDSSSSSSESGGRSKESKNDHGHKKILVVNKRPRPPLPSFIFLPNMETPFFPPIGLPPPPVQMYPMVPVPPVMAPPFPPFSYPGVTPYGRADDCETTSISSVTTEESHPTAHTTTTITTSSNGNGVTSDPTTLDDTNVDHVESQEKSENNNEPPSIGRLSKTRGSPRQKLMQKLRENMKRKNKLQNYFANQYQGPQSEIIDGDLPPDFMLPNHDFVTPNVNVREDELPPGLRDVDFKYISQLIHKRNFNKTPVPPISNKYNTNINQDQLWSSRKKYVDSDNNYSNLAANPENNFHNNKMAYEMQNILNQPSNNVPHRPEYSNQRFKNNKETNDTYYTNLGREIALMVRNIDGDREVDIEIESDDNTPSTPVIFGNSFGSKSFWERSVRSPFQFMKSFNKEMEKLRKSNENLYSLENEVEFAASTIPNLSLQQLENILYTIEKAKIKLTNNYDLKQSELSKTSFNVNLLSGNDHPFRSNKGHNVTSQYYPHDVKRDRKLHSQTPTHSKIQKVLKLRNNFLGLVPVSNKNRTAYEKNAMHNIRPTRKPNKLKLTQHNIPTNFSQINNVTNQLYPNIRVSPTLSQASDYNVAYHHLKPELLKHNNFNYKTIKNNRYLFEKATIPIRYPTIPKYKNLGRQIVPSYFHHQLHHFDYFDK